MVNCLRAFVQLNTFLTLPQEFESPTSNPSLTTFDREPEAGGQGLRAHPHTSPQVVAPQVASHLYHRKPLLGMTGDDQRPRAHLVFYSDESLGIW